MNDAGNGHTVLDLVVNDAVAADDHGAGLFDLIGAALENFAEDGNIHLPLGKTNDVHAGLGIAAHRVNIAQRIGRGDLPEEVWVINDGREKVHRVDDRQVRAQSVHPGVIGGFGAD